MTSRAAVLVAALTLLLSACTEGEGSSLSPSPATTAAMPTPSTPAGSSSPVQSSPTVSGSAAGTPAVLTIVAPGPGQRITLPAQVEYWVTGVAISSGAALRLTARDLKPIDLPLTEPAGGVTVPDDKGAFLPGVRDLTFQVVTRDGKALTTAVTIRHVTIEGRRVAGGRAAQP
jgi:hypothetical protein